MFTATIFADIAIDPYASTRVGSCPPLFSNPLWELYNALFASTLTILLLIIFKINYKVSELMVALNIYFILRGIFFFSTLYGHNLCWLYSAILSEYCGKVTLLYTINFLTVGFLFSKE